MPLKTIQLSNISTLDHHHLHQPSKFLIIGHRGNGMNTFNSSTNSSTKENSILSFNEAARFPIQFIEFDVQVTSDDQPVIFHDSFILAQNEQEKRVTELTLQQFLSHNNKQLQRKTSNGEEPANWTVENDDALCTLEQAFVRVDPRLGFNIELKFDDDIVYKDEEIVHALQIIMGCVFKHAGTRDIIFSTFQPDAARLVRKMQSLYRVFFLTEGGMEIYDDERMNSLEEAARLCVECGLQGVVSDVRALMRRPWMVKEMREVGVGGVMSYGEMNSVVEVVQLQCLMGVDGVIVDRVKEIAEMVPGFLSGGEEEEEGGGGLMKVNFSQGELEFVLKLISKLVRE